jgi:hypothetical protein
MKTKYHLLTVIVLFVLLSGCSVGNEILTDISDDRNQYDKHGNPDKVQSFEKYTAEREKRIREEQLTEEQRVKNANRDIPSENTKE